MSDITPGNDPPRWIADSPMLTEAYNEGYADGCRNTSEVERLREALRRIESMDADREDEEQADLEWSCADDYYVHRQMMRRIAKEALDA